MTATNGLDFRAFHQAVTGKLRNLDENSDRAVEELAQEIADKMRTDAPRLTGETANSIRVRTVGHAEREIVMGGASLFLVFGTSKMPPEDFARPALAEGPRRFEPPTFK